MTALTAPAWRSAKAWLILATSLLLLLTLLTPPPAQAAGEGRGDLSADDLEAASVDGVSSPPGGSAAVDLGRGDEPRRYLIRLQDPAVPTYRGGVEGFEATAPRGSQRLDSDSNAVQSYQSHLVQQQAALADRMDGIAGRDVEIPFTYQYAINGMAAVLTPDEARAVAADPAVVDIRPDAERELHTDAGPEWIDADEVWAEGADLPTGNEPCVGSCGEGIIIGTIDTGISPANPSFADVGGDGYDHTNPRGEYYGVCDPDHEQYDPNFQCNDKLIGAYGFVDGFGAVDYDGHGSHTASTSGGNVVNDVVVTTQSGFTTPPFDIAGVAPHANIIAYLGCCSVSGLTESIDQAIEDQVHVINYSIGSSAPSALWDDFDTVGFLNARAAGIVVATSNGNDGPLEATTGSPSDAPWIISVGASSHNRYNLNVLIDLTSSEGALPDIEGKSVTGDLPSTPIVYAGDFGDPLCLEDEGNEANFTGNIVICERGVNGRVAKSENVAAQGAAGFVLINDELNDSALTGDEFAVPGVFISYADGQTLLAWLDNGATDHSAAVAGTDFIIDDARADVLIAFSSRGPNRAVDVIVPDVTAPGVDILAALGAGGAEEPIDYGVVQHGFISGTSMASPHVAGASALIVQERPDWTPAQIQSALMTTAVPTVEDFDGDLATPYEQGAGRIDVDAALAAGLLFDETFADYMAANPAEGGDPSSLNLPSFANTQCLVQCSWQRTATVPDTVSDDVTWTASTVSDTGLTLDVDLTNATVSPGEEMGITVTADVDIALEGETLFGRITLEPSDATIPSVTMPVAVVPSSGVLPGEIDVTTRRDAGSQLVEGIEAIEITDFTASVSGLVEADQFAVELDQDSDNTDPYDDLTDGVFFTTVEVEAGARTLIAEILDSEAPDLDLFVGTGDTPSLATEVCTSTSGTAAERCDVPDPSAGTWWVLVQNWNSSDSPPDALTLATAVVPQDDLGNASVEGPETNPTGEPFDIRFIWDLDDAEAGDRYYGIVDLGSDPSSPGDIGSIPVTLDRIADDVTKTADVAEAEPGDTVTYTVDLQPNVTPEDLTYTITDAIPDGMTYVEGSLTGEDASHTDGVITWTPTMPTPLGAEGGYAITTSGTDPSCAVPFGDGTYVDFRAFGIGPADNVVGDTQPFTVGLSGAPFEFLGQPYTGMTFTDDGFLVFDPDANYGGDPWVPQEVPDPALPNNLLAMLWDDYQIVYDTSSDDAGVSLVTFGGDGPDSAYVIDYRHLPPYFGTGTPDFSEAVTMQVWTFRSIDNTPGFYEFYVAFDELNSLTNDVTAGWENATGTNGGALYNNEPATGLTADTVICYDYEGPTFEARSITYQATVDADAETGTYTNNAVHITTDPYAQPATASADVAVTGQDGETPGGVPAVSVTATDDAFVFARTGETDADLTVAYDVDGSAEPGEDYTELPGTVTIREGSSTAVVDVEILDDATDGATIEVTVQDGDSYDVGTPASATITIDADGTTPPPGTDPDETEVLAGATRIQTAIAISQASFPEDGSADAVILARSDIPFDALAGTPLAPDKNAPLLLTQSDELHPDTAAEISRVMAEDGIVYVLGGTAAIEDDVIDSLTADGHEWERIFGPTRYETALAVANEIGDPDAILVASGELFPDALSAGAAADEAGGIVLLTPDNAPHDVVTTYVADRPDTPVYAIGGPAAGVFPDAQPIVGTGREATAVLVAEEFFDAPTMVGLARGDEFADALTGGAHAALQGGPILLTPTDLLHPEVVPYLCANSDTLNRGFVYGGDDAIQPGVVEDFTARMDGEGCAAG